MKNIAKNNSVSVAIYSTHFHVNDDVYGIQLTGEAMLVPDKEVAQAYHYYFKRKFPKTKKHPAATSSDFTGKSTWRFVKIKPKRMYYFDTRFFGEKRQTVPSKYYQR